MSFLVNAKNSSLKAASNNVSNNADSAPTDAGAPEAQSDAGSYKLVAEFSRQPDALTNPAPTDASILNGFRQPAATHKMPNPRLTRSELHDGFRYADKTQPTELFAATGPVVSDIQQGGVGDCYFLATLAAITAKDPSAITDMIRTNADGSYSVRFYVNQGVRFTEQWFTVSPKLAQKAGAELAANTPTDNTTGKAILWVALIEKAYADYNSLYHVGGIGGRSYDGTNGGLSSMAYQTITGRTASDKPLALMSDATLVNELSKANGDGELMATSHLFHKPVKSIYDQHVYTVTGTEDRDGVTYVNLHNPWGTKTTPYGDDVTLTLAEFRQAFLFISIPDKKNRMLAADIKQAVIHLIP